MIFAAFTISNRYQQCIDENNTRDNRTSKFLLEVEQSVCTPNNVILDIYVDNDSLVSINSTHLFCGVLSCLDQLDTSFLQCVVLCRSNRHIFSAVCCLVSINSTHLFCSVLSCVDQLDTSFLRCVFLSINSMHLFCGVLSCVDQLDASFLRCVVLCRSTRYIFSAVCCLVSINSIHLFCSVLSCVDQLDTSFLRCVVLCRSTLHIFSAVCCLVSINSIHLFCGVLSCVDKLYTSFLRCVVLFVFVMCHVSNVTSISGLYSLVRFLRRLFLYEVEHYTIAAFCVGNHPDLST